MRITANFPKYRNMWLWAVLLLFFSSVAVGASNIAPLYSVITASSEDTSTGQLAVKAVDGVVDGFPGDYTKEWATVGGKAGSWIRLDWSSAYTVDHVVLYDRPNLKDQVLGGTLLFSDGTSVSVGSLPNDGTGLTVTFAPRTATWVRFTVNSVTSTTQNVGLSELQVFGSTSATATDSVMIVAAHPDDESLMAAGVMKHALDTADAVKVVIMTNGDAGGDGLTREAESKAALADKLGLNVNDIIFLGYPDKGLQSIYNDYPTAAYGSYTSVAGKTSTYGNQGLGGKDFHSYQTGTSGAYNRGTLAADLQALLNRYRPSKIYTHSPADQNPDHRVTYNVLRDAAVSLMKIQPQFRPDAYITTIHDPVDYPFIDRWSPSAGTPQTASYGAGDKTWPNPAFTGTANNLTDNRKRFTPSESFSEPPHLYKTPFSWSDRIRLAMPSVMQDTNLANNLKYQMIDGYVSQRVGSWGLIYAFGKNEEIFWKQDWSRDIAMIATITASSENSATFQQAANVADGIPDGFPGNSQAEWSTNGETVGAWLLMDWPQPHSIDQVVLYDRPNASDQIISGTLTFSDGTSMLVNPVGGLPNDGQMYTVNLTPKKNITWVRFTVNSVSATTTNVGLAEMRVLEVPSTVSNHQPVFIRGPWAGSYSLTANATTTITAPAYDADSDNLSYTWSSSQGGSFFGSGPTVAYQAPTAAGLDTITVGVSDNTNPQISASFTIAVAPGASVIGNLSAIASSTQKSVYPASNAVDGNLSTRWSSAYSDPQWLQIDLGGTYDVSRVVLHWEYAFGRAYEIQTSNDGITWVPRFTENNGDGGVDDNSFPAVTARYLRVYCVQRGTPYGYSLWEVEVYGVPQQPASAVLTTINITPANPTLIIGSTQPFYAETLDQYGYPINAILSWTVDGGGSIDPNTGVFIAGTIGGPYTVTASSSDGAITGTTSITVTDSLPVNVIGNLSAIASSTQKSVYPASNAVDGNLSTRWSSAYSDPQWLQIDLGGTYDVSRVVLHWEYAFGRAYEIQTSNDGITWVPRFTENNGDGGVDDNSFPAVTARYLRVYCVQRGTPYGYSLWEVEVYGVPQQPASAVLTTINITPANPTLIIGSTQPFYAETLDQYGYPINAILSWTVDGGGSIDPNTGVFIAGTIGGPYTVTASSSDGAITGTTSITVTDSLPVNVNVAPNYSAITASSEDTSTGQLAVKAVDGVVDGFPGDYTKEWATVGGKAGSWIRLDWSSAYTVDHVVLYDRPNLKDQVLGGTLLFSDGTSVSVGSLPNDGTGLTVTFAPRTATWVRFTVNSVTSTTQNVGLSELQVFGSTSGGTNTAPSITAGPTATPSDIGEDQTLQLSVTASDPDLDTLTYLWQPASGTITGTGATVTFNPPAVTADTVVRINLTVSDPGGLSATGYVDVMVRNVGSGGLSSNIAMLSFVSASSQYTSTDQAAVKAVDEVVDGYPGDYTKEWATVGGKAGSWIQLNWYSAYTVDHVVLYDRPNSADRVLSGTLLFSDGTSVSVGSLPNDGTGLTVTFTPRTVTWIRFTVNSVTSTTENIGLAEMQVFSTTNDQTVMYKQNFNSGSATGWTVLDDPNAVHAPSTWSVVNGRYQESSGSRYADNVGILGQTPNGYELTSTYSLYNSGSYEPLDLRLQVRSMDIGVLGVLFGYQDNSNYYRFSLSKREGYRKLEKRVGGAFSELASSPQSYTTNQWMSLRIVKQNGVIIVFLDGEQIMAVADNTFAGGKFALWASRNGPSIFDNLIVLSAPSQPVVGLTTPIEYAVDTNGLLDTTAVVTTTAGVGGVQFVVDEGTAGAQSAISYAAPYSTQFNFPTAGNHEVRAYVLDGSAQRQYPLHGTGAVDFQPVIGVNGLYLTGFGDSITDGVFDYLAVDDVSTDGRNTSGGYEPVLNNELTIAYSQPVTVIDEGNPGDTSSQGAQKIETVLARTSGSQAYLVLFGSNDSGGSLPVPSGLVAAEYAGSYKESMQGIIDAIISAGKKVFIAKVPPVIGNSTRNAIIEEYNQVVDDLVSENSVSGLVFSGPDFYTYFTNNPSGIGPDHLHPNGAGYAAMGALWKNSLMGNL